MGGKIRCETNQNVMSSLPRTAPAGGACSAKVRRQSAVHQHDAERMGDAQRRVEIKQDETANRDDGEGEARGEADSELEPDRVHMPPSCP